MAAGRAPPGQVSLRSDDGVLAGGAWSTKLAQALGTPIPLETPRGYHITVMTNPLTLRHILMTKKHHLMINAMWMALRLGSSVGFAGMVFTRTGAIDLSAVPPSQFAH